MTDSFRPTLWHVTARQVRAGGGTPQAVDLSSVFGVTPNEFHANGIVKLVMVNGNQLSFVKLNRSARRGSLRGTRTSPNLRGPSTIARARKLYLVVNADFNTSTTPFTVRRRAARPARGSTRPGGRRCRRCA